MNLTFQNFWNLINKNSSNLIEKGIKCNTRNDMRDCKKTILK